jgi:hypothetical protein
VKHVLWLCAYAVCRIIWHFIGIFHLIGICVLCKGSLLHISPKSYSGMQQISPAVQGLVEMLRHYLLARSGARRAAWKRKVRG